MDDDAIQLQIKNEFHELCIAPRGRTRKRDTRSRSQYRAAGNNSGNRPPDINREKSFDFQFSYLGNIFSTRLIAQCKTIYKGELAAKEFSVRTDSLQKKRPCIDILISIPPNDTNLEVYREQELHQFDSMISANDDTNRCFNPVLAPNRTNPNERLRYSSTDVLQTLKTKLQYLLPNPHNLPVVIQDAATTKYVALTPFHILRGQPPFYAKYGYEYRNLIPLLIILPSVSWMEIRSRPYFGAITLGERITQITGRDYGDFSSILDILQEITFEDESRANELFILEHRPDSKRILHNELSLSLAVLRAIAKQRGYRDSQLSLYGGENNIFSAIHNPMSPGWIEFSNRLIFRNFVPVVEGGRRKTRRKTKTRKSYSF